MPTSPIPQILQEAYVLATGRSASAATQARYEALVTQGNGYSLVAQEIDAAMGQVAAANGVIATLKIIALNGLGVSLGDAEAASVAASLVARGVDSWSKLFEFCINLQDSNGSVLDHRAEAGLAFNAKLAALGKVSLFSGATVDAAVKNLMQNIDASATSVSNGQSGLDTLAVKLTSAGIQSSVVDGYIAGAKVFVDANGDGILNAGEYSTTTDASGNFVLPSSGPAGTLFASGGTDLLTNKPFKGTLAAMAGSTVVNPLTTMVQTLVNSGQAGSVAQASAMVRQALGISAGINLLSYDPMAVLASSTATAAEKATALAVERTILQLVNVMTQVSAVIDAVKGSGSSASSVIPALASVLAAASFPGGSGTVNLSSNNVLRGVIEAAATNAGTPSVTTNAAKVALVTAASNAAAAVATTITDLAKVAVVSQGSATDALAAGAAAGSLDAAVSGFTGNNLDAAIAAAVPGAVPSGGSGAAPAVFTVNKDGANIVSFVAAGAQISVTEAGGTYTFTSNAATGTATGTIAGIAVPASSTLSINSVLASGKAFSGAGTALVIANVAGEDLTAFTATGVTGFALTSGQNYTLTAAQAAMGRIGVAGAAGTLTDAGTITVKDTLAALGGGVAATLKTAGADIVTANAAPGDISATTVTGVDSIILAAGSYTMTAAQAALVNGTTGSQTVTVTTLAAGVLPASIESFVLGNFANTVTLGAAAQNVSSPAGTATTLTIAGTTPTGTWTLANGADVLVATTGANITGVNAGAATTAENLTLTGGITMTQAQHEALAITATGGSDAVTITTAGAVTARAAVESYTVSSGGANNLTVNAGATGITGITGNAGNATTVTVGGNTVSGTWALGNGADLIVATTGANISGVNAGGATTAENLTLTGAITMTQAQHEALAFTAGGGADAVTITTSGAVTGKSGVESYTVSSGGANNLTLLVGATAITGAAGNATTVTVGGNTVSGTWALGNGADEITASNGASIAGVNAGAATTAETLNITGTVSMTLAQHEAMAIAVGSSADVAKITTAGTATAKATVGTYSLSSVASNTLTVNAGKLDVAINGAAGFATTVDLGAKSASGTWSLANGADAILATNGANLSGVNGGAATSAESLVFTGGGTVTMTAAQHNALAITAAGTDTVVIAGGGTLTAKAGIETYTLQGGVTNLTVDAGTTGVNLTGVNDGLGAVNVTINGLTVNGTWNLAASSDAIVASTGANISGVNAGTATTAENLTLTGGIIMTQAQAAGLTNVTAAGVSDSITITSGGAVTARAAVETYTVSGGASNTVFVTATTNVNGVASNATTVSVGGNTVTGVYILNNGADVLDASNGANIAGATLTQVERLTLAGAITMTASQYSGFTGGITAGGGSDTIVLTTALSGEVLNAAVENFTLFAANNTANLGANGQTINAQALTAGQSLTLAGSLAATVLLDAGALSAGSATGALTVTAGNGANTLVTGSGNDTVNAGDGADFITGGAGLDTLNGQNGNDTFLYGSMAEFLSANAVLDLVDGGNDIDTAQIAGAITLTTASDLTRMTSVEQITARSQSATNLAHSIVVNSDFFLGGVNVIDLSGDTKAGSSATIDFTGVTTAVTLKGVGVGVNNITGGSGADTLVGGNGTDFFYYSSAASFISGTAVVDLIDGSGGIDSISVAGPLTVTGTQSLARITNVENLRAETNLGSARAYSLTIQSDANLGSISKIDLVYDQASGSTATVNLTGVNRDMTVTGVFQGTNVITGGAGADTLSGGRVNDTFRGSLGNDTITTSITGAATYIFESTASANGNDTLIGVRSGGAFKFSDFLGTGVAMKAAAVLVTDPLSLDLTGAEHIGVRYGSSSLSTGSIKTVNTSTAGDVIVADNGKAVVFSFSSGSPSSSANGSIYYVEDLDSGAGQSWAVTLVGTMTSTSATITQMVLSGVYL